MKLKIAILLILSVINCKAQTNNNNLMQKKIEVFDIKGYYERSKEPMKIFDIEKFDKNKNHRKEYADTLYNETIIKQRERERERVY